MIFKIFKSIILFCLPLFAIGQITITPTDNQDFTPQKIIENVFLGEGVEITNINFEGIETSLGVFENGKSTIGIDRGFVLSTGNVSVIPQNAEETADFNVPMANAEDDDLEALAGINITDVIKYEITFIPNSDTLRFKYVFASDEYPRAVCSITNDAFGFFINGPNPDGGIYTNKNIALVPDPNSSSDFLNLPVSINTVNGGETVQSDTTGSGCVLSNDQFFNESNPLSAPIYNGYLDVFIAEAVVIPCEEYTIKIVIADGKDASFDSAVFLEEKSFKTNTLIITNNSPGLNGAISEGCQPGSIEMILSGIRNTAYPIGLRALDDLSLPDIAIPGEDFEDIPSLVTIPIGQTSISVPLIALPDNEQEDTELLYLEVTTDICKVDTITIPITENNLSSLVMPDTIAICFGEGDVIQASLGDLPESGTRTFANAQSYEISNNIEVISPIEISGLLIEKLNPELIANICLENLSHTRLNDLDIFLQAPSGDLLELTTANGNRPDNELQVDTFVRTCFNINATNPINNGNSVLGDMDLSNPTYTGEYLPEGDFNTWLSTNGSSVNGIYNLIINDTLGQFSGTLTQWSITFNSEYDVSYEWFPKNGIVDCNCDSISFVLENSQNYYLSVTDTYGCFTLDSTWINVDSMPMTPDIINCEALSTSTVMFSWTPTPDTPEYQIRINNAGLWISTSVNSTQLTNGFEVTTSMNSEFTISGLTPEEIISITFRAINNNGCVSDIRTASCQSLPCEGSVPIVNNIIIDQPLCDNEIEIPVEIIATDPDLPLTYRINLNGAYTIENQTGIFTDLPQGTWPIRIIDSQGCATLDTIRINDPLPINIIANLELISCHDAADGYIEINAFGVFSPFEYEWQDGITDNIRENLDEGSYTIIATDQQGCTNSAIFILENPDEIVYNYVQVDTINCLQTNFGVATLDIQGGWAPYQIQWSDGSIRPIINNQLPGTESFIITDSQGCSLSDSSLIIQNTTFDVSSQFNPIQCFTDTIGMATITATNGSAPYSFDWDNGETGNIATMLHAGINTVTVTDNQECEVIHTVEIDSPPQIEIEFNPTSPSCIGESDGALTIEINGGIGAPYEINWFNNENTNTITNLEAGEYCVSVTDATLCEAVSCFNLPNTQRIFTDPTIISVECLGDCDGSISLTSFGGSGMFNYAWSGPENFSSLEQNIDELCPGIYNVTVSEVSNPTCFEIFEFEITVENELEAFIQTNRFISCFGGVDGILIAVPSGGVPDYTYEWSSNVPTTNENSASNLSAGIYKLTITDANGCQNFAVDTLVEPDSLALTFNNTDITCFGDSTGVAVVKINGGTSPYNTIWETGETGTVITNVGAGNYSVTVSDRLGCTTVDRTLVNEPIDSIFIMPELEPVTCFEGSDGRISITTENTEEPVMYSLDNEDFKFDPIFVGLQSGFYTIYIIDDNECQQQLEIFLDESPPLELDLGNDIVVFFGEEANLNVLVANNTGDLTYEWESPNENIFFSCQDCPNPIVSNITTSFTVSVSVTDQNGCSGRQVINVFVDQEDQIDVPTIFTPNRDNINDRLQVFGSPDLRVKTFKVYSRWGDVMYEENNFIPNDPTKGWDGIARGSVAPEGTYTWTAEYILENGDSAFKSGQTFLKL